MERYKQSGFEDTKSKIRFISNTLDSTGILFRDGDIKSNEDKVNCAASILSLEEEANALLKNPFLSKEEVVSLQQEVEEVRKKAQFLRDCIQNIQV